MALQYGQSLYFYILTSRKICGRRKRKEENVFLYHTEAVVPKVSKSSWIMRELGLWRGSSGVIERGFQALSQPRLRGICLLENGMRVGVELFFSYRSIEFIFNTAAGYNVTFCMQTTFDCKKWFSPAATNFISCFIVLFC